MSDLQFDELVKRLRQGDYLEVSTGGGVFEVWAEPYGNPPAIFFEGEAYPIEKVPEIAEQILGRVRAGEIRCHWVDKRDD